jgi:hypothetical protein
VPERREGRNRAHDRPPAPSFPGAGSPPFEPRARRP